MYSILIMLCIMITRLNSLNIVYKRRIVKSNIYMTGKGGSPFIPKSQLINSRNSLKLVTTSMIVSLGLYQSVVNAAVDDDLPTTSTTGAASTASIFNEKIIETIKSKINFGLLRAPYNHVNLELKEFLGQKATIVFNMKIDDPQTVLQFPDLLEIYKRYKSMGLNVLAFPTEQGWFEPDDDETCRAKAKEYYGFGDYPNAVVFDKVDLLGPSATPLYSALTKQLATPNEYARITLNYEKFLLDKDGNPVRRYPRKFSAYDMESDILALLEGQPLPPESPQYLKAWREAKREAVKSEYAFRYNYNYYTSPDSMYKYNSNNDGK